MSWSISRDPLAVLRMAVRKLKPTGFIVTSLPNVAHGDVRLSLLHGAFRYRETGLLDRTHVRFFTLETVRELLARGGIGRRRHPNAWSCPCSTPSSACRGEDYSEEVLDEIRADAEFETYQFVMKSVIDNGSHAVADMANRVDTLADRVQELEVRNRILEDQVVHLADYDELREKHARVGAQLDGWIAHAAELNAQIGQLTDELEAATARADELGASAHALGAALEDSERRYDAHPELQFFQSHQASSSLRDPWAWRPMSGADPSAPVRPLTIG